MPLNASASVGTNIRELHTGKTYAHTAEKFGKDRANKQAIAIALNTARKRADGGGLANADRVPRRDSGGTVANPVNAVINALQAGSGSNLGIGSANLDAPSSPAATAASSPTAGSSQAPSSVTSINPATTTPTPGALTPAPAPAPAPSPASFGSPAAPPVVSAMQNATAMPSSNSNPASFVPNNTSLLGGLDPTQQTNTTAPVNPASFQNGIAIPGGIAPPMNAAGAALADGGAAGGGGFSMGQSPMLNAPWFERQEARSLHVGPVLSNVPGRTDNHQVKVPAGSYVLPAQHIASMGHGNTNAGMSIASTMFGSSSGPYGTSATHIGGHSNMPHPPRAMTTFADGGGYSEGGARGTHSYEPVPVDISGGEYVIPPWEIMRRYGSLKKGHASLDKWVMDTRKDEIATQKKLPPPVKK